jgi:hypothetical protein
VAVYLEETAMRNFALVVTLVLATVSVVFAQEGPRAESTLFRSLGQAQWVAVAADIATTSYLTEERGFREANPLVEPYADKPAILAPVALASTWLLNRATARIYRSHPRVATALRFVAVGVQGYAVASNTRHVVVYVRRAR